MTEVELVVEDGVAVIRLAAPHRRNALTPQMATELVAACDAVDTDPSVAAVVVTGGASFCAGADLGTLGGAGTDPASDEAYRDVDQIYEAFLRVGRIEAPTIAAIRGAAVGAGVNLALATDLRIMARDARVISGFMRIGVHPGGGHFVLATRAAGRETAAAMALFGEEVSGTRAVELGFAWAAFDDDQVEDRALEFGRRLRKDPALARRAVRTFRLESGPPGATWDVGVQAERAPQMWSFRRRADR